MVMSGRSIKTDTIGQLEILQEVIIQLELTIEALALVLIQMVIQNVVRVHHAIRCIVITRCVKDIVLVFQLNDSDVTRCLHDRVVHILEALTSLYEVVLLVSIVQRRTESQTLNLVRTTGRESVLLIAVSIGGDDTVIRDLRERHEVVALVGCTVERYTVRETETSVEEVLHVVLDRQI